jgi:hypothetical protein
VLNIMRVIKSKEHVINQVFSSSLEPGSSYNILGGNIFIYLWFV